MARAETCKNGVQCWVDLAAPDVEAAKAFYAGLLGWQWISAKMPQGFT